MNRRRSRRRGYAVAVLIGFEENRAVLWHVFSNVVKVKKTVELGGSRKSERTSYNFHESIINTLRLALKEGVRSIVLVAPARTDYAKGFLDHVQRHHSWLVQDTGPNAAFFAELVGVASTIAEVADLAKTNEFRRLIGETTSEEAECIVDTLEKRLNALGNDSIVLYSLEEIEELIYGMWKRDSPKPEHLILTDEYLENSKEKGRIQRLLQIASNKRVRTKIVSADTVAGNRLTQLGGMVCFTKSSQRLGYS